MPQQQIVALWHFVFYVDDKLTQNLFARSRVRLKGGRD
jgi:hypothetical protein